jgi:FMN reductase
VEVLDVRCLDLPLYDFRWTPATSGVALLAEAAARADGMVWSSPLYHGSVSGAFKNALDWLQLLARADPPFLTDKPVGLIATAAGVQSLQAVNTMEHVVRALRGWTVPFVVPIGRAHQAFDESGMPRDAALAEQLAKLGREVATAARRFAPAAAPPATD